MTLETQQNEAFRLDSTSTVAIMRLRTILAFTWLIGAIAIFPPSLYGSFEPRPMLAQSQSRWDQRIAEDDRRWQEAIRQDDRRWQQSVDRDQSNWERRFGNGPESATSTAPAAANAPTRQPANPTGLVIMAQQQLFGPKLMVTVSGENSGRPHGPGFPDTRVIRHMGLFGWVPASAESFLLPRVGRRPLVLVAIDSKNGPAVELIIQDRDLSADQHKALVRFLNTGKTVIVIGTRSPATSRAPQTQRTSSMNHPPTLEQLVAHHPGLLERLREMAIQTPAELVEYATAVNNDLQQLARQFGISEAETERLLERARMALPEAIRERSTRKPQPEEPRNIDGYPLPVIDK